MTKDFSNPTRRSLIKASGAAGTIGIVAGCITGGGGDGDGGDTPSPTSGDGGDGGTVGTTKTAQQSVTLGAPSLEGGKYEFQQPGMTQTINMAVDEINAAGGPQGAELNVKIRGTASRPQQMRQVAQTFFNSDDAVGIVGGGVSTELVPIFDFLKDFDAPIVSPFSGAQFWDKRGGDRGTPENLSDDGGWFWRTVGSDTVYTAGTALQALNNDMTRAGIMHGPSAGSRSWRDGFKKAYETGGGTVVNSIEFETKKTSYQSELDRLFGEDFDCWLLAGPQDDVITIVREWHNAGYGTQLFIENGFISEKLRTQTGEAGEGAWIVAASSDRGPYSSDLEQRFKEYGDAEHHYFVPPCYDSVVATALALHRADELSGAGIQRNLGPVGRRSEGAVDVSTFEEGKEALDNGEEINFEGANTACNFTDFGNVIPKPGVLRMTPDEYEEFKTLDTDELREIADI